MAKKTPPRTAARKTTRNRAVAAPPAPPDPVTQYARDILAGVIPAGRPVRLLCERHLRDLARAGTKAFPYRFEPARVTRMLDFFESFLTLDDVAADGQHLPFRLVRWLQFAFGSLLGWVHAETGRQRFVEAYFETGKGSTKCLALDTPIATPAGWSTIAALSVGDQVFDERGRPCTVLEVSDVKRGHACYRVEFDDGTAIVADAEHLWFTEQRTFSRRGETLATAGIPLRQRGAWRFGLRSTQAIRDTLRYANGRYQSANHSVPLTQPLGLPATQLPIEPYVLGAWLGDGDSDVGRLTVADGDAELCDIVAAAGASVGERRQTPNRTPRYRIDGLTAQLRAANLLHNKHVPAAYLRGSVEQRLALLQGLMDTDGHITPARGECQFTSTINQVATGVAELLVSLGVKCTIAQKQGRLYGRPTSPYWRVSFSAPPDLPVFRLTRKLRWQRPRHRRRRLSADRRIVAVTSVESVPVRCIAVDSPSHLFLAGRAMVPTHNTPAAAGFGLYRLVGLNRTAVENYSLGVNADQANYLYQFAKKMAERSQDLQDLLSIGEYNTAWEERNSFFRPLTSEGRSLDNKRVFTAFIEELHEHPSPVIPEKMRLGIKGQVDALIVHLTNAGFDKTSVCWAKHDYGIKILEGSVVDEEYFPYICQLDPCEACRANGALQPTEGCAACDDWTDERVWPKVNPALLELPTLVDYLRGVVRQAQNQPSMLARVKRLNFCVWSQTHAIWIPFDQWDACKVTMPRPPRGVPTAAAFDLSTKEDLTACVIAQRFDDEPAAAAETVEIDDTEAGKAIQRTIVVNYRIRLTAFAWLPEETLRERVKNEQIPYNIWSVQPTEADPWLRVTLGPAVDYHEIYDHFVNVIGPRFSPQRVGFDPYNASFLGTDLRDKAKYVTAEIKQGRALSEVIKLFNAMVRLRRIEHDGNPVLAWCVANAEPKRDRYENVWLEKPAGGKRIDLALAAVMAVGQVITLPAPKPRRKRGMARVWTPGGFQEIGAESHA